MPQGMVAAGAQGAELTARRMTTVGGKRAQSISHIRVVTSFWLMTLIWDPVSIMKAKVSSRS